MEDGFMNNDNEKYLKKILELEDEITILTNMARFIVSLKEKVRSTLLVDKPVFNN